MRAVWQLGSFRAAAKETPDRIRANVTISITLHTHTHTHTESLEAISLQPPQFRFDGSQVKVSFCDVRMRLVGGLN